MKAKVFKKSIQTVTIFPPLYSNFVYFIEKHMKSKILKEEEDYFMIDIPDDFLTEQKYQDKIWYRSQDRKFGLFDDTEMKYDETEEKGWRVLFQRR